MSIYFDILKSLKNRVEKVAGGVPVLLRKRPIFLVDDPLPCIVVSPDLNGESIEYLTFQPCIEVTYEYPCLVTIFEAGDRVQEIYTDKYLLLRESVRNVLFQPTLEGAETVYDANIDMSGSYALVEQRNNFETTTFRIRFKSLETRLA